MADVERYRGMYSTIIAAYLSLLSASPLSHWLTLSPTPTPTPIIYTSQIHPADKEILLYNCMGLEYHINPEATRERRSKHAHAVLETQAHQHKLGYYDDLEIGKISSVSSQKSRKRAHHIALLYHQFLSKGR